MSVGTQGITVSVVIMAKDEEHNIAKCLESVRDFDQVFVVDSDSTDRTCAIAGEMGANVVQFVWSGGYPKKKQWCLENLPFTFKWVLYVDADEEITSGLALEIRHVVNSDARHSGYFIGYEYVFMGNRLRFGHRIYKLALFDRHRGIFPRQDDLEATKMWEVEGHFQPQISGSVGSLRNRMIHKDINGLYEFFDRHNRYSDWEAVVHLKGGIEGETQVGLRGILKRASRSLPWRGKWLLAFLYSYVFRLGFLDGSAGFHYAMSRAFYYWQIGLKISELNERRV